MAVGGTNKDVKFGMHNCPVAISHDQIPPHSPPRLRNAAVLCFQTAPAVPEYMSITLPGFKFRCSCSPRIVTSSALQMTVDSGLSQLLSVEGRIKVRRYP